MKSFDPAHIDRQGLTRRHKVAIADCILAWARLDTHLRVMLTAVEGRPLTTGAANYKRLRSNLSWSKLYQALRDQGASPAVLSVLQRHRKDFKVHSDARNLIAHAGCIGTWRADSECLVFAPFETYGEEQLALVLQPISVIDSSTRWARAASVMAEKIIRAAGY